MTDIPISEALESLESLAAGDPARTARYQEIAAQRPAEDGLEWRAWSLWVRAILDQWQGRVLGPEAGSWEPVPARDMARERGPAENGRASFVDPWDARADLA